MYWPGVLKSKLMPVIGVTVNVVDAVAVPAQLEATTLTLMPFKASARLEIAKVVAVAPDTFTPLVRHWKPTVAVPLAAAVNTAPLPIGVV